MDLIRSMLMAIEEAPAGETVRGEALGFDDVDAYTLAAHAQLLHERGLIEGSFLPETIPVHFRVFRITWNGHEYLDAIRNETVWTETKTTIRKRGLELTFDVVKSVATGIIMHRLSLPPG
jgi:Hypothetical protein (DUF2513).